MPKYRRVLLVVVAVVATALGGAACGPSHPHPKQTTTGPGGY
jgi:hypothetical protein